MENAKPGHLVEIHSLKGAVHLNGKRGHLVKFDKQQQRWAVRCDNENKNVGVKADNLRRVQDDGRSEIARRGQRTRTPSTPKMSTSDSHGDVNSLNKAVLDSYYERRMGGAVVFFGNEYMLAVEFFGPHGARGAEVEMVSVGRDRSARAVVQQRRCASAKELGRNFLTGETIEYIEAANESSFFGLLDRYTRQARSKGNLIDMKSGLYLYEAIIR